MKNIGGIGDICQNKFTLQRANLWQGWELLAMWVKVLLILQQDNCEKNLEGLAIFIDIAKGIIIVAIDNACSAMYIRPYLQVHHIDAYCMEVLYCKARYTLVISSVDSWWDDEGMWLDLDILEHLWHPPQKQINMFCPNLHMILMFSMDGVQLYCNKQSNCWVTIWITFNHHPNCHYKKKYVSSASIIPGPQKPKKNSDLFLYPSIHHPAALQKEGLHIWDASSDSTFVSAPFLLWAL